MFSNIFKGLLHISGYIVPFLSLELCLFIFSLFLRLTTRIIISLMFSNKFLAFLLNFNVFLIYAVSLELFSFYFFWVYFNFSILASRIDCLIIIFFQFFSLLNKNTQDYDFCIKMVGQVKAVFAPFHEHIKITAIIKQTTWRNI